MPDVISQAREPRYPGLIIETDLVLLWCRGRQWRTVQPLIIRWDDGQLTVPANVCTDLASVPRPLRWIVSVVGDWARASVAHDYIYARQPVGWTRWDADRLFLEVLFADGVPPWRAWLMYSGVRVGGWWLW